MGTVYWEGNDLAGDITYGYNLISYERTVEMCTGEGRLTVQVKTDAVDPYSPITYNTWDELELWEEGGRKGIFYISSIVEDANTGMTTLDAQDGSKKLTDTFIAELYEPTTETTAREWIEFFLPQAQVSYNFNTSENGATLSTNTSLGLQNVYDQLFQLCQISGWFFYFDGDGICQIGELNLTPGGVDVHLDLERILSYQTSKNDKMLRNGVTVWGNAVAAPDGSTAWVFAHLETTTPWNYDENDIRTIVYANTLIPNTISAYILAQQILDTFSTITFEKTFEMEGDIDTEIGQVIAGPVEYSVSGLLTTIVSSKDETQGTRTTLVLDQRCPRLFGFISYDDDYVYIGTWGDGVWRKQLDFFAWENWSTGLTGNALYVDDLQIHNGVAIARCGDRFAYTRNSQGNQWNKIEHGNFTDYITGSTVHEAQIEPQAVTINKTTGDMYVGYRPWAGDDLQLSWIGRVPPSGSSLLDSYQMFIDTGDPPGNYDVKVFDIDTDDNKIVAIVEAVTQTPSDDASCQPDIFTSDITPICSGAVHCGPLEIDEPNRFQVIHNVAIPSTHRRFSEPVVCANDIWVMRYERNTGDAYIYHYEQSQNPVDLTIYPEVGTFSVVSGTGYQIEYGYTPSSTDEYVYFIIHDNANPATYYVYQYSKLYNTLSLLRSDSFTRGRITPGIYNYRTKNYFFDIGGSATPPYSLTFTAHDWLTGTELVRTLYTGQGDSGWEDTERQVYLNTGYNYASVGSLVSLRETDQSVASIDFYHRAFNVDTGSFTSLDTYNIWPAYEPPADELRNNFFIYGDDSWVESPSCTKPVVGGTLYSEDGRPRYYIFQWSIDYTADLDPVDGTPEPYTYSMWHRRDVIDDDVDDSGVGGAGNLAQADYVWMVCGDEPRRFIYADSGQLNKTVADITGTTVIGAAGGVRNWGGLSPVRVYDYYDNDLYFMDDVLVAANNYRIDLHQVTNDNDYTTKTIDGILTLGTGYILYGTGGAQNVAWVRNSAGGMSMIIFGPWDAVNLTSSHLVYGNQGGFKIVANKSSTSLIEVNKQSPVVVFSTLSAQEYNKLLVWYPPSLSGVLHTPVAPAGFVTDARTFDLIEGVEFTMSGGTYIPSGGIGKHLLISVSGRAMFTPLIASGAIGTWRNLTAEVTSGIQHLETTNFLYPPHLFLAGGGSGNSFFYERKSGNSIFTEYSTFLPGSEITVVRMDDTI